MTDPQLLLAQYVRDGSESAFRELVQRYLDLVYSTALRLVGGDRHLAEDVAQTVFVALARKASTLPPGVMLGGWLHHHTRFVAANLMRGETRRRIRERQAAEMNSLQDHTPDNLARISPILDESIGQLKEEDRTAILLRFFEQRNLRGVGEALGITEDAARKRVSRALDELQVLLRRRGVVLSSAALAGFLAGQVITAAPTGLALAIAGFALGQVTGGIGFTATLLRLLGLAKPKLALIGMLGTGVVAITALVWGRSHHPAPSDLPAEASSEASTAGQTAEEKIVPEPVAVPIAPLPPVLVPVAEAPLTSPPPQLAGYALRDLGSLPGFVSSRAAAMNAQGQIVGWADKVNDITHAFIWENGMMSDLGTFGGNESLASGINASGEVVGAFLTNGERRVFLWRRNQFVDLGVLDHFAKLGDAGNFNPGIAINDLGQVTGRLTLADGNQRSFIFDRGGISYFGLLGNGAIGYAQGIDADGQILGQIIEKGGTSKAFLWQQGTMRELETLRGPRACATAANDMGLVAGWAVPAQGNLDAAHAVLWEQGRIRDLGTLSGKTSRAYAINHSGQIVGYAVGANGNSQAFVYQHAQMSDLNAMVVSNSGWQLVCADAINDRGQIVALGIKDGVRHACLLEMLNPAEVAPGTIASTRNPAPISEITRNRSVPLNLVSLEKLPDGSCRLAFRGNPGEQYVIETSTDLRRWTRLGRAENQDGISVFVDRSAPYSPLRFYRFARAR